MGRPEPCALFSHSFVHAQLDEYVDEVLFAGPVVVTGCEFLEQNASPSVPAVSLIGATSPPSFALEVFVHCEGESRFRRLCQPFLYSPSSSNVLEVEAVVTSHLIVRGTYRSLSLVIYGNTAEDLGQFNIDVDMDTSLANLIYSSEGKIEDLPAPLRSIKLPLEDSISSLNTLSLPLPAPDLSNEMKEFLFLVFKIWKNTDLSNALCKVVSAATSLVCSFLYNGFGPDISICRMKPSLLMEGRKAQSVSDVLSDAMEELSKLYEDHQTSLENEKLTSTADGGTEYLFDSFDKCFPHEKFADLQNLVLSQNKIIVFYLGIAMILCSAKKTCYQFLMSGGMEKIFNILGSEFQSSSGIALLLLCAVEQATRHAIGCEAFLGWWPRKDIDVPIANSDGYCRLLNFLIQRQRHDSASLATYILHRLRLYEVCARYESEVLSLFMNLSEGRVPSLGASDSFLKGILKLLSVQASVEDPSLVASAKLSARCQTELLSYRETVDFISESKYGFSSGDIDSHLLSLLMERGFLPLSAALLSSPILRLGSGDTMEIFLEIAASIELILLRLLSCRSGLTFLVLHSEATTLLVSSLQGFEDSDRTDNLTLRHAAVLISKGFFCRPQDIATIVDVHLRVGSTVDRLLSSPHSEEQLWTLWELCAISRSDSGRHALLSVGKFPEAVSVLIRILRSFKDVESVGTRSGSSSSNIAIFHFAAEIIEIIVVDSNASSLASWIRHAVDLHGALHVSTPGFNKKDAPSRVLDWIDAAVVYHKNGAVGLLRYAAVLASGGDAHLSSSSVLVSESTNVENVVGDSSSASDSFFVDNLLGKFVADKQFDGVALPDMSLIQLTTAFRILAFISDNSTVATLLFDEGAVTLVLMILVNCRFILERSSNTFDYLVDEGTECGSTSDLLMEQSIEQRVVDLMIPSLHLLINLLRKLREGKEQYRNTKLLKALLRLHRELSPKLAAYESGVSFQFSSLALGLCTVCRLLASAMACWPIYGWTPGLFHCLLEGVQASSLAFALGPRDACSFLCLLGDLFPEENICLWKNGIPSLTALRTLSVGTILGPEGEKSIEWHFQPEHMTVLLTRLTPQLTKISQVVLHFCFSDLVVVRDMLRVLVIRISCQRAECAVLLMEPVITWIINHTKEIIAQSEVDLFKAQKLLEFMVSLLEHPQAKEFLLRMGILKIIEQILWQCVHALENREHAQNLGDFLNFCVLCSKSLALIFDSNETDDDIPLENTSILNGSGIIPLILNLCKVLPVGRELLGCLLTLKVIISSAKGKEVFQSFSSPIHLPETVEHADREHDFFEWRNLRPFLVCWGNLFRAFKDNESSSTHAVECIHLLSLCSLSLCGECGNSEAALSSVKSLFGLPSEEIIEDIQKMIPLFDQKIQDDDESIMSPKSLTRVKQAMKSLISLLQKPGSLSLEDSYALTKSTPPNYFAQLLRFRPDYDDAIKNSFVWECADVAPERLLMSSLAAKRKLSSTEGSVRRPRDSSSEAPTSNGFPRGPGPLTGSSGLSRRDTFRQRKPNTSRPPSMHVDDYVARERNADVSGSGTSLAVAGQRGGVSSGRPPSIHVDEFMARQRERQSSSSIQAKTTPPPLGSDSEAEKAEKPQKLKPVLDDDHEINIVFDEELESEDKMLFPTPDDNLMHANLPIRASSPQPFMEDDESEIIDDGSLRGRLGSTSEQRSFFQEQFTPTSSSSSSLSSASHLYHDNKAIMSQPPLPPTPPPALSPIPVPAALAAAQSYSSLRDLPPPPLPSGFPVLQGSVSIPSFQPANSNSAARTTPPLTPLSLSSTTPSLPPFAPWQVPSSASLFTSTVASQSVPPRLAPPPPLPPPLAVPRPSLPQPFPPPPPSLPVQLSSLPIPHLLYYQPQQPENLSQLRPQSSDNRIQEQDPAVSLQQYFSSPEAIESLLNDRDKLCQLLEQHPKLVQMLQERLGQM